VILIRPTTHGGRLLYQVVAVDKGRERVISPPLSREKAVKVMVWAASRPAAAFFAKAGV